ncbi:MAG: ice-binding family protein [Sphaerochaeta sp.]|nr:ice-binding family protein [Sphaerochaeta sp.]
MTVFSLLLVLVLVVSFTNCKLDDAPALNSDLTLRFTSDPGARTLTPDSLNLAVVTYDISGTGPRGEVLSIVGITTDTYVLENLAPGEWSLVAKGKNIDGIVIVQSPTTVINLNSANNDLILSLLPLEGSGTFGLDLSWPVDLIGTPEIVAILTPDVGEAIALDFVITGTSASIVPFSLPRGYYELTLKLTDASFDSYLVWSKVETVLIFADATTSENWVLVSTDMNTATPQNLGLVIDSDTKSPIEMVLTGAVAELAYDTNMTVTATGTPVPTSYKWFLDADELVGQTTSSVTVGVGLAENTIHTLTVVGRNGDIAGSADATFLIGEAPIIISSVDLKTAGTYVILAQSAISGNAGTTVVGDIGASPVTAAAITGFALILDGSGTFSTSELVTGAIYASDYTEPTPTNLTQAVLDSNDAYAAAQSRVELEVVDTLIGEIGGMTLAPGLYKWSSAVSITTNLTLDGPANGVWIFQMTGSLTEAANAQVLLSGGALAENIFWQVEGGVLLGANAHMEGVVLSGTSIALGAGASVHGRLYAKTAVTLDTATVTQP